jgi:PhzF family phenazine biosynthesis protein
MHETNVGLLPLEVIEDEAPAPKIIMTLTKPNILSSLNESQISSLADALKIETQMISRVAPPHIISTGLAQLFVRMDDLENVKALTPDLEKVKGLEEKLRIVGIAVFTLNTVSDEASAHLRFFAPSIGITEDAAAGSAAGGLGAYLAMTKALPESKLFDFSVEQGLELGRPSRLYVSVLTRNGYPEAVKVGGYSTTLLTGTLKLE